MRKRQIKGKTPAEAMPTALFSALVSVLLAGSLHAGNFATDYQKALTLRKQGKLEAAEKAFLELSDRDYRRPRNKDEALAGAADCALRRKNYDQAIELASKINSKPMRELWMMKVFRRQRKWDDVLRVSKDADLATWPDRLVFEARMCRGLAHAAKKDAKAAEADFLAARGSTLDHDDQIGSMRELTNLYRRQLNEEDKARRLEDEIIEIRCRDAIATAQRLIKINRYSTALRYLDKIDLETVSLPEWKCRVLLCHGDVHAAFGKNAKALDAYRRASAVADASAELLTESQEKIAGIEKKTSE